MRTHETAEHPKARKLPSINAVRGGLLVSRMTLAALRRIEDWKRLPKPARDVAIAALHVGRRIELDLGYQENAEACETAIKLLEEITKEDA